MEPGRIDTLHYGAREDRNAVMELWMIGMLHYGAWEDMNTALWSWG